MKKINWKYTLGEIIIVMIGILLAFQLQTWNEERKEHGLVSAYLENLKQNLLQDQNQFEQEQKMLESIDSSLTALNRILQEERPVLDQGGMRLIHEITNWYFLFIRSTTFNDLYNSGRLNLLPEIQLRLDLSTYYEYTDLVKSFDDNTSETQRGFLQQIVAIVPFGKENWRPNVEDRTLITNMAWSIKGKIQSTFSHLRNLKTINADIVARIDRLLGVAAED